jgi:YtfJ family uncharacterized protein
MRDSSKESECQADANTRAGTTETNLNTPVRKRLYVATQRVAQRFKLGGSEGYELKSKGGVIMKHLQKLCVALFALFGAPQMVQGVELGQVPPKVELQENLGGRLDGTTWRSDELKGKVHVLFYVDPDEKDTNNDASEALDKEKFPAEKFQSVAIINMAATWLPNFAISMSIEDKQKRYPRTIYVRDYKKLLVDAWKIADDSSDILAFDKQGKLIFRKDGKLNTEDIQKLIKSIKDNL